MQMVLIIITVVIYLLATKLYEKFTFPFTLPVLTVTTIMICLFLIFGISHHEYREMGRHSFKLIESCNRSVSDTTI